MADIVTLQDLSNAKTDIEDIGRSLYVDGVITPRYGNVYKSMPMVSREAEEKADKMVAQGFYASYTTEALLKADKPNIPVLRAKADDTKKVWRWERSSAEGVIPVVGTWFDTGLSELDRAKDYVDEEVNTLTNAFSTTLTGFANSVEGAIDNAKTEAVAESIDFAQIKADSALSDAKLYVDQEVNTLSNAVDTTLTDAKLYTDMKTKSIHENEAEVLFSFEDGIDNKVVRVFEDGDIETPKIGLLSQAIQKSLNDANEYTDLKTQFLEKDGDDILFSFDDDDDNKVIKITADGDILTPLIPETGIARFLNKIANSSGQLNEKDNIVELYDDDRNVVFAVTGDGDINYPKKMRDNRKFYNSVPITDVEHLTDDFQRLYSNAKLLNGDCILPVSKGMYSQHFKIKNPQDFLNLKITQPERIVIDTPYFNDGQIVHPFFWSSYKRFRGYKHILAATPYENTNDIYENPCLYGTNDLINYELLKDITQPLVERYVGNYNYNSDVFCLYDHTTDDFCVCWRNGGAVAEGFDLWMMRTKDGISFSEKEMLFERTLELILSPNIIFNPKINKWVMYSVTNDINKTFSGNKFNYRTADKLDGNWSAPVFIETPFVSWHQETRYCGSHFITIINDNYSSHNIFLGFSEDGFNWVFNPETIMTGEYLPTYKASIVPEIDGKRVKFHIFWTSSNQTDNLDARWRLFNVVTDSIEIVEV